MIIIIIIIMMMIIIIIITIIIIIIVIIISPVKNKIHTKSYKLNDKKFTVYIKLKFLKKISGCQMKENKSSHVFA